MTIETPSPQVPRDDWARSQRVRRDDWVLRVNPPELRDLRGAVKGYEADHFGWWHGNDCCAKLNVCNVSPEIWDRANPTVFHFKAHRGWCVSHDTRGMSLHELYPHVRDHLSLALSRKLPADATPEQIEEAYAAYRKLYSYHHYKKALMSLRLALVDRPQPSYAFVSEGLRRAGLATELYAGASLYYAERGLLLYASTLRSEQACALWAHFERLGWAVKCSESPAGVALDPDRIPQRYSFDKSDN